MKIPEEIVKKLRKFQAKSIEQYQESPNFSEADRKCSGHYYTGCWFSDLMAHEILTNPTKYGLAHATK